jgi:uncharacterized repeat protein (TIGR03803 family)
MSHTFTHAKKSYAIIASNTTLQKIKMKKICALIFLLCASLISYLSIAQNVLVGLTSNGGPQGRGTAFSMNTSGANFSVIKGFEDWGKAPNGDLLLGDDGNFYGMTYTGGTYTYPGTIFMMTPTGAITILRQLNGSVDGQYPYGELTKGADGNFYGVTSSGGTNTYGTIFKITPTGAYTVLKNFNISTDGSNPRGHLVLAADGNFYGMTYGGGQYGYGTIFKITPGGTFTTIHSLNKTTEGSNSYSSLTLGKDGNLYGVTCYGGTYNYGTVFKITTSGTFTVLRHLNGSTDGGNSQGDLIQAKDGNFYGMCYGGGTYANGTIFKITSSGTFTVLKALSSGKDGGYPYGNLFQNSDGVLYGMTRSGGANGDGAVFSITTAGVYKLLHSFSHATEGGTPSGSLIKGNDGNLYGMTSTGGAFGWGTAFKVTTTGTLTVLTNFNGATFGNTPYETLVKGADSAYYGTTSSGGSYGFGTIFKICGGATTVLHSFNRNLEGGVPKGSLILANDGNFYGMTPEGGSKGYGTIFKMKPGGNYSVLHEFNSPTEGSTAQGSLVQGSDGNLYGMTNAGGPNGTGTIFKITLTGTFTLLHSFVSVSEGANPEGNLIQATDGNFYGMTTNSPRAFKITPSGTFTVLHTFVSGTDGYTPVGSFVQGTDGNFYATTSTSGTYGAGTIFKMTPAGTITVLKHLNGTTDGKYPKGNLLQAPDGNFYGMTYYGGTNNIGVIFKIKSGGTFTVLHNFDMAADGGNPYGSLILAPVNNLIANAQSITTPEDTKKIITLAGSGAPTLTYNILTKSAHGKLSGTLPKQTYSPNLNYNGDDQFTFNVSVGCISSAPATVSITVSPVVDTPVLAPIGNKSVVKSTTLTFTATATDGDKGQTLKFSLVNAPAGATINATNGVFTWTPATAGNYSFKVRVTDNGSPALYDEEPIMVTVTNSFAASEEQSQSATVQTKATLYPNPVIDKFYITLNAPLDKITIRIININGAVMSTTQYNVSGKNKLELDASQLQRGIYIIELQTEQRRQTLRFIKS